MANYCPNCGGPMNPNCSYCDSRTAEAKKSVISAQLRKKLIIYGVSALVVILFAGLGINSLISHMNDPEASYNKAEAYFKEGKHDKAIKSYTSAIELKPGNIPALCGRGRAYVETGEYDKAIVDYTVAIKLKPGDIDALIGRGHAYSKMKNYKAAVIDYTIANSVKPGDLEILFNRAIAHMNMGYDNQAIADYEAVLKITPNNTGVKQILENLRKKQKKK